MSSPDFVPLSGSDHAGLWRPRAARRSKISSSDPPLLAVSAPYPAHPLPSLFHPPIELAGFRPRGHLDFDGWIDCSAISLGKPLEVVAAEVHI